jgi:isopenicillin-N epimerase
MPSEESDPEADLTTTSWRSLWSLDPDIEYLTHGTFGAAPIPVLLAQQELRARLERQPVQFLVRELEALLDDARAVLAQFVGADPDDLAFVTNATSAVNAVLRSLRFAPGDEILTTDHGYAACHNAMRFVAEPAGARVVTAPVPFPLESPDQVIEAVLAHAGPRTRLAVLDHVTSPTAVVFPIERLVRGLEARGIDTLVDGAHAPGMLPLDLRELGAAYYTGNCHKWLCAPKGAAFLVVRRDRQAGIHPNTISHGASSTRTDRSRFHLEFDWTGSDDPTAWLAVPAALRTLGGLLPGGWPELMQRNHALAVAGRGRVCAALGTSAPCPDAMLGSMASLPLPPGDATSPPAMLQNEPLQDELMQRYRIEVPVFPWPAPPRRMLRLSAQIYNRLEQYERLAAALRELLAP